MQPNKNTNIILGILAIVVLVFVFIFIKGDGGEMVTSGLVAESTADSTEISSFLRRISAIKDVNLDLSVFDNPVLKNGLKDNSQELVPEDKGRTNPFSPIDGMTSSVSGGFSNANNQVPPVTVRVPETRVLSD